MQGISFFVSPIPDHAFFEQAQLQRLLSHHLLQIMRLSAKVLHFISGRRPCRIAGKPGLTCFHKLLRPGVIQALGNNFLAAQLGNGVIAASLPNDPNDGLELVIHYRPSGDLKPPRRRLRKPNKRQDAAFRAHIANHGLLNPILIDEEGRIIVGEARGRAAQDLGLEQVPTITISHLSEEQLRIFAIAEERIPELSEWDET